MHHLETDDDPDTGRRENLNSTRLKIAAIGATTLAIASGLITGYLRVTDERAGEGWDLQRTLMSIGISLLLLCIAGGLHHAAGRSRSAHEPQKQPQEQEQGTLR